MSSFLGTYDLGGDGKTILLALINAQLGTNYTLDQFKLSDPYVPDAGSPHNTAIDFVPVAITGHYGARRIYYDRINIADYGAIYLVDTTSTTLTELIDAINAKLGILLTAADIVEAELTSESGGMTATLMITDTCPVFYGSTSVHTVATLPVPAPAPTEAPIVQSVWADVQW